MNKEQLKSILAVPTYSFNEERMVAFLVNWAVVRGIRHYVDEHNNVFMIKGPASGKRPCVAAHIDTVQPVIPDSPVEVVEDSGCIIGMRKDVQAGLGADDKTGIAVGLELITRADSICGAFFAAEECGMIGARNAKPEFFQNYPSCVIEYDCPGRGIVSYKCSGVRLFEDEGEFIKTALPVLQKHNSTLWQVHPYTDVTALRKRFPLSCINLSSGYYNWHAPNEFVNVYDVEHAINQGEELVRALNGKDYPCPVRLQEDRPAQGVTGLHVPAPVYG